MFSQYNNVYVSCVLLILSLQVNLYNADSDDNFSERFELAQEHANRVYVAFAEMFETCIKSHVSSENFKIDNLKGYINYASRTTVGTAPKVTTNRKFFAHLVASREFKEMLEQDVDNIKKNFIKKMKYCDSVVMNAQILEDFYDREVDPSKM